HVKKTIGLLSLLLWTSFSLCQQTPASRVSAAADVQLKTLASNIQKLQEALKVLTPDSPAYKPLFEEYMQQTAQLTGLLTPGQQLATSQSVPKPAQQRPTSAPTQSAPL